MYKDVLDKRLGRWVTPGRTYIYILGREMVLYNEQCKARVLIGLEECVIRV